MSDECSLEASVAYDGKRMVCETDLDGKISYVNRCFATMTGYAVQECLGKTFELIRHEDVPMCLFSKMWSALKQREDWSGYFKIKTKEGKFFWASIFITPRVDENNKVVGYTSAFGQAEPLMIEQMSQLYAEAIEKERCSEDMIDDMNIANLAPN